MKKTALLLTIALAFQVASLYAQAGTGPNGPNDFDIANSALGGVKITKYKGTRTNVIIPETIDGLKVTELDSYSFSITDWRQNPTGIVTINSVVLPSTLIAIGQWAFKSQPLTSIAFPNLLRKIDRSAFDGTNSPPLLYPTV